MSSTDRPSGGGRWFGWSAVAGLGLLAACSPSPPPGAASAAAATGSNGTASTAPQTGSPSNPSPGSSASASPGSAPAPGAAALVARTSAPSALTGPGDRPSRHAVAPKSTLRPPTEVARDWADYRRRAAQRLVEANPGRSHTGPVREPLLAVPVLQIDLHADGSIQRIAVLRQPHFAKDTTKLAEDAVRRAAPFGSVAHLPKPWRLTETFLFDEDRRFKPRTLDDE